MSRGEAAGWIAGLVGLAVTLPGLLVAPDAMPHAWLAAVACWVGWPLGSLALLFIHAMVDGGRWGEVIRPPLLAGVRALPLIVPAALPIFLAKPALYPWARAGAGARFWLDDAFFDARGLVYAVVWLLLGGLALRAERRGGVPKSLAAPGLILLALTITFAQIDWTMSLDPRFASSAWGLIEIAASVLLALSVALWASAGAMPAGVRVDLGKLLLGVTVLWAYLDFMQVLICWQSDLPDEAAWYGRRIAGFWGVMAAVVVLLHFALPFFALLLPAVQRSVRAIRATSGVLIFAAILRAWWVVLPEARPAPGVFDAAAMAALFGFGAGIGVWATGRAGRETRHV